MKAFGYLFPISQSPDIEVIINPEVIVISRSDTEQSDEVEVISNTKIHSCEVCAKLFASKKKLSSHQIKTSHSLRSSISILDNSRLDRPYQD